MTIDGYATTERDREMLLRGIRAALEAAAKWHDDEAVRCDGEAAYYIAGGMEEMTLNIEAIKHCHAAECIRALSPESILEQMEKNQP